MLDEFAHQRGYDARQYEQNIAGAESMTSFGYPWAFSPRDLQPVAGL